jgi:hypothetical protein
VPSFDPNPDSSLQPGPVDDAPAGDFEETPGSEDDQQDQPTDELETDDLEEPEPDDDDELLDPEPDAPPAEPLDPVVVRAGGESFTVPGALLAPEGMYVPKEHLNAVLSLIQRGRHHEMTWPQEQKRFQQEIQRQEALRNVEVAEAAAWTAEITKVFQNEDAVLAFIDNLGPNLDAIKARVAQARMLKENEVLRQGIRLDQPATELSGQELVQAASESLLSYFDQIVAQADVQTLLGDDDADQVWRLVAKKAPTYITKAPADDPSVGVRKGETVIDLDKLDQDVRTYIELLSRGRTRGAAIKKPLDRAARINDAVNGARRQPKPARRLPSGGRPANDEPPVNEYDAWRKRMLAAARSEE